MKNFKRILVAGALAALIPVAAVRADSLRNVSPGETVPEFRLNTIDGGVVDSKEMRGKVVILVFLSAEQRSSEQVATDAQAVLRDLGEKDVALVFATADVARTDYFRRQRDRSKVHEPLGLDFERKLYGDLGLIVQPTTVVMDREGKLAHVISARPTAYPHLLTAFARHALGTLDDAALEEALETKRFERDRPEDRIARHRAAARLLRKNGLLPDSEKELQAALAIDAAHLDAQLDLAALYLAMDRADAAAAIVAVVVEAQPSHRRARLIEGVVLFKLQRLDEAEQVLRKALLLNPDPVLAHYYLGRIYEARGETEKALLHYKESLSRMIEDRAL